MSPDEANDIAKQLANDLEDEARREFIMSGALTQHGHNERRRDLLRKAEAVRLLTDIEMGRACAYCGDGC